MEKELKGQEEAERREGMLGLHRKKEHAETKNCMRPGERHAGGCRGQEDVPVDEGGEGGEEAAKTAECEHPWGWRCAVCLLGRGPRKQLSSEEVIKSSTRPFGHPR